MIEKSTTVFYFHTILALVVCLSGCRTGGVDGVRAGAEAAGNKPVEFQVGERPTPRVPPGITPVVVPAVVNERPAVYRRGPVEPAHEGIRAHDIPKPPRPTPKGRGRPLGNDIEIGPAGGAEDPSSAISAPSPEALASALSASFDSTNFDDNANFTRFLFIPPDPHGAVGLEDVVNVVNTTVRFHNKAATFATTFHDSLQNFFAPLTPLTFTFDPKVLYDQFADRFVIVTLEQTDTFFGDPDDISRILVAVSDDGDPNGIWNMTSIPVEVTPSATGVPSWADYPGLAVDEEAVYITANLFGFFSFGAPFGGVRLWVIDKELGSGGFYDGGTADVSLFDPYNVFDNATTTQPAHVFGTTPTSPNVGTWLVSYSGFTNGVDESVQIVRVDDPIGPGMTTFTQQFLNIGDIEPLIPLVPSPLPSAPQSGSSFPIATSDRRALDAVWRDDGSLWMTATINPNAATSPDDVGEATAHWWQMDTTTLASLALVQQGSIGGR